MQTAIFQPVLAQIALTFVVGFVMLGARIHAVATGRVSERYFLLVKGDAPEHLLRLSNNLNNLLALPMLFYVMCLVAFVTGHADERFLTLAWLFFASRVLHSVIHITYNHLLQRMVAFLVGLVLLIIMLVSLYLSFSAA